MCLTLSRSVRSPAAIVPPVDGEVDVEAFADIRRYQDVFNGSLTDGGTVLHEQCVCACRRNFIDMMCHQDHRQTWYGRRERIKVGHKSFSTAEVKSGTWFVEQHDVWVAHQCPGEKYSLLFA